MVSVLSFCCKVTTFSVLRFIFFRFMMVYVPFFILCCRKISSIIRQKTQEAEPHHHDVTPP